MKKQNLEEDQNYDNEQLEAELIQMEKKLNLNDQSKKKNKQTQAYTPQAELATDEVIHSKEPLSDNNPEPLKNEKESKKSKEPTLTIAQEIKKIEVQQERIKTAELANSKNKTKFEEGVQHVPSCVLEVSHLKKYYGEYRVFDDLSFKVFSGDIVGVVGENGAGKSTLFKCIAGVSPRQAGDITVNGLSLAEGRKYQSILWVDNGFDGNLTVKQNYEFYCDLYDMPLDEADIKSKLAEFGVAKVYNSSFKYLSTGQRRKCAIVRSFLKKKVALYLLDEATGGLDFSSQATYHKFVKNHAKLNPNCGFLLITHVFTDLQNLCNKLLILENGQIVDYATMDEIKKSYLLGYVISVLIESEPEVLSAVSKILQNVENCQFVIKQNASTKLIPVYIRFLGPLNEFNAVDKFLTKYIVQKTVRALDLQTFLDLLMAGVVFKKIKNTNDAATQ